MRLSLDSIHLDFELRDIGLVGTDGKRHPRCLRNSVLECIQRILQGTVSEPGSIFQIKRITRSVAETLNGRRHQRIGKAFLDVRKLCIEFFVDLRCATATLIKRLEDNVSHRKVWRIDLLQGAKA